MMNFPGFGCEEFLAQAYREAQARYGKFDLAIDTYFDHLVSIIRKYLGNDPSEEEASGRGSS